MQYLQALVENPIIFIALCSVVSLMVGSFLNVVIYRLPIMMERAWQQEVEEATADNRGQSHEPYFSGAATETFNLATPRSRCPHCSQPISAWQNMPVISYLILAGKCAHCTASISARYPAIEFTTALLSGIVAWQFQSTPVTAMLAIVFTWALIALFWIDYDTYLLPDNITLPLLWLGLIANYFGLFTSLQNALWGAIAGYMVLWSVFWAFKLLTGKEGMGYGDFKLLAALGAWLGWQMIPAIILLSSLVGAVIGICMIVFSNHDKSKPIPFGPYLTAAGWLALVWGNTINQTYLNYVGLN